MAIGSIAIFLASCGEDSTVENITQVNQSGIEVISDVSKLPKCKKDNDGEMVWVKGEYAPRKCTDSKWYAVAEGSVAATCTTKELKDKSGVKIICGGDSIGVVLNGKDGKDGADGKDGVNGKDGKDGAKGEKGDKGDTGATGAQGKQGVAGKNGATGAQGEKGDKGDTGAAGAGCSMEKIDEQSVRVICGKDSSILYTGSAPSETTQDTVVLDSEKIAVSLDEVSGVTQKGPFLMGSKVLVREMEDGHTLTQTGNSFNGKILNDKGEFKINARMLVSQYVMLEATGYYRNEVTGQNSNSELTLFAITDVNDRNIVNINLLTHLEYERVIYLVTQKKMKVRAAKKQAQKEVFGLLNIDATNFSNSEDLNIAGSSDEDGALLAFSLMFQGDRSVANLTTLLQTIANDMEKDGTWDDAATRMKIAEWSADADSAGKLATIRNNVAGWGLSSKVPNFEQFVRNFWYKEYGLDSCTAKKAGTVKAATAGKQKGTKTRYICKDAAEGAIASDLRWVIASDFEKDTYGWAAGKDGEVKVGSVTKSKYYLYDAVTKEWRDASVVEQKLGGCIESVAANISKNTGFVNGYWYKCENHEWVRTTAYIVDTQGWVKGSDGDVQKGDSTSAYYVYDEAEKQWRDASENDVNLGLMGCTTNRTGEMGRSSKDNRYYSCASNHAWTLMVDKVAYNTIGYDCDKEGKMVLGLVDTKTYFVCESGIWREATTEEEQAGAACTANMNGQYNKDSTRICENTHFREVLVYDFDVGVKNYFNPEVEYGTLKDKRDGHSYKTVTINGITVMAENLNYADEGTHSYLVGNNWCYNDDTTNCLKGGRYYTWTAAMDIDSKWQKDSVPAGMIGNPHQGICPDGWHIPDNAEWSDLFVNVVYWARQAVGNVGWPKATNASGFSALPVGYRLGDRYEQVGSTAYFWSTTQYYNNVVAALGWYLEAYDARFYTGKNGYQFKPNGLSVRCIQDTP